MAQFVKRWLAFLLLQAAVFGGWLILAQPPPNSYAARMTDKHDRLQQLAGPRLILIGGSNAAFGYDCTVFDEQLALEPVNMGLYAGLGMEFMCAEVDPQVRAGDVIVLSLEYWHFEPHTTFDRQFWRTILFRPQCVREWLAADKKRLADDGLGFFAAIAQYGWERFHNPPLTMPSRPYSYDSFDEYGDVVMHWQYGPSRPLEAQVLIAPVPRRDIARRVERLREYVSRWEALGARVFVDYPHIPVESYRNHAATLAVLDQEMRAAFGNRVLLRVEQIPWAEREFYDSEYHLNRPGMQRRAEELAARLAVGLRVPPIPLRGK